MEISVKELRAKPGQIIAQAARGTKVVITIRGKKMARLIPYKESTKSNHMENNSVDEIFGLWKDRLKKGSSLLLTLVWAEQGI